MFSPKRKPTSDLQDLEDQLLRAPKKVQKLSDDDKSISSFEVNETASDSGSEYYNTCSYQQHLKEIKHVTVSSFFALFEEEEIACDDETKIDKSKPETTAPVKKSFDKKISLDSIDNKFNNC